MSNNSSFLDTTDCVSHKTFKVASTIVFCFSGSFINGSILVALLRRSKLSIVNTIIFHLTLSDMVVFVGNGPYLFLTFFNPSLAFTPLICEIAAFIGRYTTTVSMYLLMVMSLSRFYSLARPLEYRVRVTASKANKMCIGAWVVTFLESLTPLLGWGKYTVIKGQCYCALDSSEFKSNWFAHLLLAFVLPLVVHAWIFTRTLLLVNCRIRDAKTIPSNPKVKNSKMSTFSKRGKQEHPSSMDNESLSNEDGASNKRNLGPQPNKKMEVVDCEVEVSVNEETKKESVFVHVNLDLGFNEKGAKNNPCRDDIIRKTVTPNEEHKLNETEVLNQGIERQGQTASIKEINISGASGTDGSCENENTYEKHVHPKKGKESEVMEKAQNHKATAVSIKDYDHDISTCYVEQATNFENTRQSHTHDTQQEKERKESFKTKNNENQKYKTSKLRDQKYDLKINTIVSLLFIAYVTGCGPTYVVWTWFALDPKSVPRAAFIAFRWFAGLQSLVNPLIYGYMNTEIRVDVLALWKNVVKWIFRKQ